MSLLHNMLSRMSLSHNMISRMNQSHNTIYCMNLSHIIILSVSFFLNRNIINIFKKTFRFFTQSVLCFSHAL